LIPYVPYIFFSFLFLFFSRPVQRAADFSSFSHRCQAKSYTIDHAIQFVFFFLFYRPIQQAADFTHSLAGVRQNLQFSFFLYRHARAAIIAACLTVGIGTYLTCLPAILRTTFMEIIEKPECGCIAARAAWSRGATADRTVWEDTRLFAACKFFLYRPERKVAAAAAKVGSPVDASTQKIADTIVYLTRLFAACHGIL
jgi:hypothetical protein